MPGIHGYWRKIIDRSTNNNQTNQYKVEDDEETKKNKITILTGFFTRELIRMSTKTVVRFNE